MNNLTPEDQEKMRNICFEAINAINEWISFEANFPRKSHPAIQNDIKELEELLPDLYLVALRLVCDILLSCNGPRLKSATDKLTNQILAWELRAAQLKDHRTKWSSRKKVIEEILSADDHVSKVLKWIKKKDDPEPALKEIKNQVTSKDRYQNYAQWFLDRPEFKDWSERFYSTETRVESKRLIWINGPYGTGKTTIVFVSGPYFRIRSNSYLVIV
jgi:hypothetical protein